MVKPKNGWYQAAHKPESSNIRAAQTMTAEFWNDVFEQTDFKEVVENKYKIAHSSMIDTVTEEDE